MGFLKVMVGGLSALVRRGPKYMVQLLFFILLRCSTFCVQICKKALHVRKVKMRVLARALRKIKKIPWPGVPGLFFRVHSQCLVLSARPFRLGPIAT
jgi:hypothetical protein